MKTKRFLLIGGATYYAEGGMNDFDSSHSTIEAAEEEGERRCREQVEFEWWHVFDCDERKCVADNGPPAYGDGEALPAMTERMTGKS